jgi:DNA polymerase delta subunit 2
VTNPYEATIDQVKFLGHAGQPIHSLLQSIFSFNDNNMNTLDCLEKCLEWRHLAPTAPDVLGCFPIEKEDPFVMEECPHVFFAGNQDSFDTRTIKGAKGQQIQLISIPSFDKTSTIVLVDLKDLSCFPLTFN